MFVTGWAGGDSAGLPGWPRSRHRLGLGLQLPLTPVQVRLQLHKPWITHGYGAGHLQKSGPGWLVSSEISSLCGGTQGAGAEAAVAQRAVRQQLGGNSCEEKLSCNWHAGITVQFGLPLLW